MTRLPRRRTARWLGRVAAAGLVGLVAALAGGLAAGPAGAATPSYVRLAHLSPDTPNVDVYMTSYTRQWKLVIKGVGYGAVSKYQRVQPDRYAVSMRPAGAPESSPPVLSTNVNASSGKAFTVAGVGPYKALGLAVINDDLSLPAKDQVRVRVLQGSARAKTVAVQAVNGPPVTGGIAFAETTPYAAVPAGKWTLQVASKEQADLKATAAVTLSAGDVYSVVVLDAADGGLTLATHTDAVSAAVTPTGSVETGAGGTAGDGLSGWLPLGAGGLGAVLLAAAYVRSRRGSATPAG